MNVKNIIMLSVAKQDLNNICLYISTDSKNRADNLLHKIRSEVKNLYLFPKKGRVIPELNKENIRELLIQNYRVMYKIEEDKIIISAVRHSSREFNLED